MPTLVLLRHGQSTWNERNLFTGWEDVDLTAHGVNEAQAAGRAMAQSGLGFDLCVTSVLRRAIKTLDHALDAMDLLWLPVEKSWRLNERHYGALQGLDKAETEARHGTAQVMAWRRSWDVRPPPMAQAQIARLAADPRYAALSPAELPSGESLADTVARTLPFWHATIAPALRTGRRVLVAAHGNSLRGLVKMISAIPDHEIADFDMPTGTPLVYSLHADLSPATRRFLQSEPPA